MSGPIEIALHPASRLDKALDAMVAAAGQVRPEHIHQILDIAARIVDARIQAGMVELGVASRLRLLEAQREADLARAANAAGILREYRDVLTPEEQGRLAAMIIRTTLGLAPEERT